MSKQVIKCKYCGWETDDLYGLIAYHLISYHYEEYSKDVVKLMME